MYTPLSIDLMIKSDNLGGKNRQADTYFHWYCCTKEIKHTCKVCLDANKYSSQQNLEVWTSLRIQVLFGFDHALEWQKNEGRFVFLQTVAYICTSMGWWPWTRLSACCSQAGKFSWSDRAGTKGLLIGVITLVLGSRKGLFNTEVKAFFFLSVISVPFFQFRFFFFSEQQNSALITWHLVLSEGCWRNV